MENDISPKYLMKLVVDIEKGVWAEYSSYKNVNFYIEKWHQSDDMYWQNFSILKNDKGEIDLARTLHSMQGDLLLKIAIDLGIETPDFIPCIPQFKNAIKESYQSAFESFQKAIKQIEEHPDLSIGLANSALESIIKEILKDSRLGIQYDKNKTLYQLTESILKAFKIYPNGEMPEEIKGIGSSLLNMNKNIECLRSTKTGVHGKTNDDYVVNDSMYAYFIINSVTTIGLFINSFYRSKFPIGSRAPLDLDDDELPF